jgi:carbon starvation protein
MSTLLVAIASFFGFILAYHTYGRWLSKRVFNLDPEAEVPSQQLQDDVDFVPTKKQVIFGHHFTSIAGTGPIVGPAIAVFWGWLPALLWVVFGSIFIGAVHDFGALVVSLRNRGQTVGQVAGRIIAPRVKILFLLILFFALTIVLAVFGLVIATIFKLYPESVLPVWISMPIAIVIGLMIHRKGGNLVLASLVALAIIYGSIWLSAYYFPIGFSETFIAQHPSFPVMFWTVILLIYCAIASVMPVWLLLQPRDYINSHQLMLVLGLLVVGIFVAGLTGQANMYSTDAALSIPAVVKAENLPAGTPPIWPFLFITIACGAVSGFHCLVSSGTSSKQLEKETDAQYVGYGAMLLEGALAVIVILACCAGVGMGKFSKQQVALADGTTATQYAQVKDADGNKLMGVAAWRNTYATNRSWAEFNRLGPTVGAFVEGGANFLTSIGIPLQLGIAMIAVMVASFAATTLDTATRLQRYVIQELGVSFRIRPLSDKYVATGVAVVCAFVVAMIPANPTAGFGTGGMILWPLFGATNQLLAGLAFLVTVFYLWRRNKPIWFAIPPMILMLVMPAWALIWNMFNAEQGFFWKMIQSDQSVWSNQSTLLFVFSLFILTLQIWMVIEAILIWPKAKGVLEEALPPLTRRPMTATGAGQL